MALNTIQFSILRALRVPPEPAVPAGRNIRVFRAAPGYYRYKLTIWLIAQLAALVGLATGLIILTRAQDATSMPVAMFFIRAAEVFAWLTFIVQLPFSFALLRLDLDMRWYILSDRSLRIREGISTVREKTMTFANVQQITIEQNPLQRFLGIADVQVRSAGGGAGGGSSSQGGGSLGEGMHQAFFRGVDNAEEIREAIRERVRKHRDTPAPDPVLPQIDSAEAETPTPLEAARELHREVQLLREALTSAR